MSATAFIAVQCYQCFTMQVKQKKRSSNKWTCVVCNEKQSLRHVYTQGHMARDVRKFVQTFNISRQFADQNCVIDQTLAPPEAEEFTSGNRERKRTDWSEYIDYEPQIRDEIEDVYEPKFVTELPKALFRKPKLSTMANKVGRENVGNGFKPVFSKRKSGDTSTTADQEPSNYQPSEIENTGTLRTVSSQLHSKPAQKFSKWSNYMVQDQKKDFGEIEVPCPILQQVGKAKGVSKWDEYVTAEEDDYIYQPKAQVGNPNRIKHQPDDDNGIFDVSVYDERVEEDIHPDFH